MYLLRAAFLLLNCIVVAKFFYGERHYAECRYTECRGATRMSNITKHFFEIS